jgi:hypothetical protein
MEASLEDLVVFQRTPERLARAAGEIQLLNPNEDYIVIGNNLSAGIAIAELVPRSLKARTVVVFNRLLTHQTGPYRRLEFSRFATREDLGVRLAEWFRLG